MKFVALALALLLAVGSQATSAEDEAAALLTPARATLHLYLEEVLKSVKRVLSKLDNTEYQELGAMLSANVDVFYKQIKDWQSNASSFTDSFVATALEITADFRNGIMADMENLRTETEDQRQILRDTVKKHIDDYKKTLEPIFTEYYAKHKQEMEDLKVKLGPVMDSLRAKMEANVQETVNVLTPIVDNLRGKMHGWSEKVKEFATPYINEYAEQVKTVYNQPQQISSELKESVGPLVTEIGEKLFAIFGIISGTLTKN